MTNSPDLYYTLGVVPDAESAVIRAAYRALATAYHPDKNSSGIAQEKIQLINAAYDTLSDPLKRKEYDSSREQRFHNATSSEFDQEKPFSNEPFEKDWAVATEFYSGIDSDAIDLERISWRLGFAFKLKILEDKTFSESSKIARKLKTEYLSRYFGKDKDVIGYAEELIKAGQKHAALYLNEIINVMGSSVSLYQIRKQVESKYPKLYSLLKNRRIYSQISNEYGVLDEYAAQELVKSHGGLVDKKFFSSKIKMQLDDETHCFESSNEFCKYVFNFFAERYA